MIYPPFPSSLPKRLFPAVLGMLIMVGCNSDHTGGQDKQARPGKGRDTVQKETGEASWYGPGFHGKETANGDTFDQGKMTAAHPTLPLGSQARVTNLENGKKVEVTINDRGPYAENRVIDLSGAAANKLGMKEDGTARVRIEAKPAKKKRAAARKTKPIGKKSAVKHARKP